MLYELETRCIHGNRGNSNNEDNDADLNSEAGFRPLTYPLYQTAAFSHRKLGHNGSGYDYTRETNPTRHHLEAVVASLENARDAIAFSSGMAAIETCLELFSPGDEILCSKDLYGGVYRLHRLVSIKNGLTVRYVDTENLESLFQAITNRVRAIYIETPTNPTMRVTDIARCATLAHDSHALLIVDNTFLTPLFQNPLDLGADIVIHSASKYLGGHNDVIGGFLCTNDETIADKLRTLAKTLGNGLAPFDSWLIERGVKTLSLRMEHQSANALRIAQWLEDHPLVEHVIYPGLKSFPDRSRFERQARGFGAMISFYVKDASIVEPFLRSVRVITFAESLGGVESLITYPLIQTHQDTPDELKKELGINDKLLRLSVGAESADDLIADLEQALDAAIRAHDSSDGSSALTSFPTTYDFDHVINRHGTYSLKFDGAQKRGLPDGLLPLWVADMDFKTAPPVLDALHKAVDFGIFGYSDCDDAYYTSVTSWFERRFHWKAEPEWIVKTPGVVFGLAQAVLAFTNPGDSVLIQPPVYYPFFSVVRDNNRVVVENELRFRDGRYEIDFDDFERKIVNAKVKLFILCSPHNPVGRVWSHEELRHLADICARHKVMVVADEIHCDITWPGSIHMMFGNVCGNLNLSWMSCTSPSKSFNLAGLQISHLFLPDDTLRRQFQRTMAHSGYSQVNLLGLVAAKAAYDRGEPWLEACKQYLYNNLGFLRNYLQRELPELHLIEPEGTYFAWIDCSKLGLSAEELDKLIINKAKLWLDAGSLFGSQSGQFQRIVFACPRATLAEALERLKRAVRDL